MMADLRLFRLMNSEEAASCLCILAASRESAEAQLDWMIRKGIVRRGVHLAGEQRFRANPATGEILETES